MHITKTTRHPIFQCLLITFSAIALMAVPTTAQAQQAVYSGIQEEIPENASRILLEQRGVSPAEMYISALNYFERTNWGVIASEGTVELNALEDIFSDTGGPLAFAVQKETSGGLVLRIAIHINPIPDGGRLIASADYATGTPAEQWQDAIWTSGSARKAFAEAIEIVRKTAYDSAEFEIGVAVQTD